jgi:hypothetical protein
MNWQRDISESSSAPEGRGLPSTCGWRTASAIRIRGSFCPTSIGAASGRRERTARASALSIPCASSIACTPFQRTISNGF